MGLKDRIALLDLFASDHPWNPVPHPHFPRRSAVITVYKRGVNYCLRQSTCRNGCFQSLKKLALVDFSAGCGISSQSTNKSHLNRAPAVFFLASHLASSNNQALRNTVLARPPFERPLHFENRRMNEETLYAFEMQVSAGEMKCPVAGAAFALRDATRASLGEPSVEP